MSGSGSDSSRGNANLTEKLFSALRASVDEKTLATKLAQISELHSASASSSPSPASSARGADGPTSSTRGGPAASASHTGISHGPHASHAAHASKASNELLSRWSLADVLDDSILGANPSSKGYPLRLLFAEMSAQMATSDEALTFAAAVNLYFRTEGEEEARVALGMEVSRAFYVFAQTLDPALRPTAAQGLATLLSSDLPRLRFESADHLTTFDSAVHERERGSSQGAAIRELRTFVCRITATGMVRTKARVLT